MKAAPIPFDNRAQAIRTLRAAVIPQLHPLDAFDLIDALNTDTVRVLATDTTRVYETSTLMVAVSTATGAVYRREHGTNQPHQPLEPVANVVTSPEPATWQ